MQKRLAVLTCQLRKAEQEKETFKVATERLLQFTEVCVEAMSDQPILVLFNFICLFIIRPFEKRDVFMLQGMESVCKLFHFRLTPPTVYIRSSWNLVYS